MSIERLVALLTPAFAAAAGWLTALIAQAIPGINIPAGDFTALFITGATAAAAAALKWLHGRQQFVKTTQDVRQVVDQVVDRVQAGQQSGPALADVERVVQAHTDQIVRAIGSAVHAPPSVEQIVDAMARQLVGGGGGSSSPTPLHPVPPPPPVA